MPWAKGETEAPPRRWDSVWTPREGEKAEGGNRARRRASGREHHDSKLRGGKPGGVQRIAGVRWSCRADRVRTLSLGVCRSITCKFVFCPLVILLKTKCDLIFVAF